jgi:hypothetical protein
MTLGVEEQDDTWELMNRSDESYVVYVLGRQLSLPRAQRRGNARVWRDGLLQSPRVLLYGWTVGKAG